MSDTVSELQDALARHRAGDAETADALYRDVLARDPEHPTALHLLGLLHLGKDDPAGAVALLRRAVALRPDHAALRRALGDAWAAMGELHEAAAEYDHALRGWDDPGIRAARALVLVRLGATEEALSEAEAAMAVAPGVEQMVALGAALRAAARAPEAANILRTAVAAAPTHAGAWVSLAHAEQALGRLREAELCLQRAIGLAPTAETYAALGQCLAEAGRLGEAEAACAEAARRAPGDATVIWAQAQIWLLRGDFARGLAAYEARKRHPRFARDFPRLPGHEWRRGDLHGRRLLVRSEQGLGDTIQFARYIPRLAARGARVTLVCAPALVSLLAQLPAQVIPKSSPLPEYDFWVDQMSLPRLFGTTPASIPATQGYLTADPDLTQAWAPRLPAGRGPRVGLVWTGTAAHDNDLRRAIPPALFERVVARPGITPVSLQVGPGSGTATASLGLTDMGALFGDFADTAAVVANLDLVISADTAVAHLAGAMGKPVWLLLPYAPDWRWMIQRADSPWYASMRLFRQTAPGDWQGVMDRVLAALDQLAVGETQAVNAVAAAAAPPVATAPHTMSATVTATDQPWMVARFVRS